MKSVGILLLLSSSRAIQLRWSPKPEDETEGLTLHGALAAKPFHLAMAPIRCAAVLHMSILQNLKKNKLSANIVSLSGSSTGGLAAAIWASIDENDQSGYTDV